MQASTLVVGRRRLGTIKGDSHGIEILLSEHGLNLESRLDKLDNEIATTDMANGGCTVFIPRGSCKGVLMSSFFEAITDH